MVLVNLHKVWGNNEYYPYSALIDLSPTYIYISIAILNRHHLEAANAGKKKNNRRLAAANDRT
jgi:hypothetical protein